MSKINAPSEPIRTREGAKAKRIDPTRELLRSVSACMLWEDGFYEDGESIAERIASLVPQVDPTRVAEIAIMARNSMKLRHVPLLMVREMARSSKEARSLVANTLYNVIQRPDEIAEFMAIYWKEEENEVNRQPLSAQVKKGLAKAFTKFDEYQLAKWNRDYKIKLRDVMFLCHAKPKGGVVGYTKEARRNGVELPNNEGSKLFHKLVTGTLETPKTWEVGLSAAGQKNIDKKTVWEELLSENKLATMALLKNLRGMLRANVNKELITTALHKCKIDKTLPFRFITAAKHAPDLENEISASMLRCMELQEKLPGLTVLLLDHSGSMNKKISSESEMTRLDAANGIAILLREICEEVAIFTFSSRFKRVPSRHGFALSDAILNSIPWGNTYLGTAIRAVYGKGMFKPKVDDLFNRVKWLSRPKFRGQNLNPDRLIVFTDEQSHDTVPDPQGLGYMINVATEKNGVGYGSWIHCDGWSEKIIDWIREYEKQGF